MEAIKVEYRSLRLYKSVHVDDLIKTTAEIFIMMVNAEYLLLLHTNMDDGSWNLDCIHYFIGWWH